MARKQSRETLEAELREARQEADCSSIVLCAIANGETPIVQVATIGKTESYTFELYRAASSHGGIVATTFLCEGQRPSVRVKYLDEMQYPTIAEYLPLNCALERLRIARARELDKEAAA